MKKRQLENIKATAVSKTGFVCSDGFDSQSKHVFVLITGDDLYL